MFHRHNRLSLVALAPSRELFITAVLTLDDFWRAACSTGRRPSVLKGPSLVACPRRLAVLLRDYEESDDTGTHPHRPPPPPTVLTVPASRALHR